MTLSLGDVVDSRYEILRDIGGDHIARVYAARDRPLARDVALRVVDAGDLAAVESLREQARRMTAVQFDCAQAVPVLDQGASDGVAYVASELVTGMTLEQLARRRAPLPPSEAARHAVELLDACRAATQGEEVRISLVPGSALVTHDGHVRVTRFAEGVADPPAVDPACAEVARILRRLLEGGTEPPDLAATIDDALDGSIATVAGFRARLYPVAQGDAPPPVPVPAEPPSRRAWPLALWSLAILAVILLLAVGVPLLLVGD